MEEMVENRQDRSRTKGQKCPKNLDFIKKSDRLQGVKIEICYVNECGIPFGECRIFDTNLAIFA